MSDLDMLPEYCNDDDRKAIHALVDAVLADGNNISIHNGGEPDEYEIEDSTDKLAILNAMMASGEDTVSVLNAEGVSQGYFILIGDNGSEGEPMIVISDYVANDYCDSVIKRVEAAVGA